MTARRMGARRAGRGFTLVEMLVALLVFSLLAAAAAGIFNVALRNAEVFDAADAATRELQIARTVMRADLAQIAPRPVRDSYGARAPTVLAGGPPARDGAVLRFVRRGWDNPGGAGARGSLQYVEYALADGALVRRTRPYLDPTQDTPETAVTLVSGVDGVTVTFLSRGQWSDRWTALASAASTPAVLPDAVALEVASPAAGRIRQAFLVGGAP